MNHILSLNPLFRRSVGFDRFADLFDPRVRGEADVSNYPPYNIEKISDAQYKVTMALAGFTVADFEITQEKDTLLVKGKSAENEADDGRNYLHRGIAKRAFQKIFRLADYVHVKSAEMRDGMLIISLQQEVPEEAKPRFIQVTGVAANNQQEVTPH